jgi:7-cyano-7-deazaguanine synthase in queuosine biosynthesis
MSQPFTMASPLEYTSDFTVAGVARRGSAKSSKARPAKDELAYANGFYVDDHVIGASFGRHLEPLYADWIDVALAAYYTDRMSPRRDPKSPSRVYQWARRISLRVPVRLPEVWNRIDVSDAVRKALDFFTDDFWSVEFVPQAGGDVLDEGQAFLFASPIVAPVYVALLSGGLDSFAGAARAVQEQTESAFIFVSGATNSRQRSAQREQVRALRRLARREVSHITVPFGLSRHGRSRGEREEQSQRARGFLFLTLGAITALTAGSSALHIHENGVGAINLPYDATQLGTSNSRGVHPLSLICMENLARALTNGSFEFRNPYLFQTKGQMCDHPAVRHLAAHIKTTFSCDGFPVQARGKPQCGSCTSCLLRRVSLEAANLAVFDPAQHYVCDLSSLTMKSSERQLRNLKAMEWQFRKLVQKLAAPDAWQSLATEFPDLQTLASELGARSLGGDREVSRQLLQLYKRYGSEWKYFSARERLGVRAQAA